MLEIVLAITRRAICELLYKINDIDKQKVSNNEKRAVK